MKLGVGERLFLAHLLLALAVVGTIVFGSPSPRGFPLVAFLGLFTVGGIGFALSLAAGRSMRQIEEAARRIAAGDTRGPLLPRGPGELAEVARSLDMVSRQLRSQIETLTVERDLREAVLAGMEEGILVLRPDARLLLCNEGARRLLGLSELADEQPLIEFVRFPSLLDAVYDATRGRPAPIHITLPGPPRREVIGKATPLPRGGEAAVIVALRDVTELRRLEAMRRDFVASASHELRTPVAAIRGYAETLASGALDDRAAAERFVAGLFRQADRLSHLIDDLLDLTRVESGGLSFLPQSTAVRSVLEPLIESFRERVSAKEQDLRTNFEDDLSLFVDPKAAGMIFGNLLENAVKYTPEKGNIVVSARREGTMIRIDVLDSGSGIEAHHLPRLFERFYRADAGRGRDEGGTGLGLAIAKHVAQQSGGEIKVESTPGKGTRFSVRLPSG